MKFNQETAWRLAPLALLITAATLTVTRYSLPAVTADGQTYLQIARNIHYGIGLGWQALWAPPLHSILIALAGWVPGVASLQSAAGIVSSLMGLLLPLVVYALAARVFDRRAALAAGILAIFFPHFNLIQFSSESEITYTTLLVCSLLFTLKSYQHPSRIAACLAGVLWSLTWMGRSEGFLVLLLTIACCALTLIRRQTTVFVRTTALILALFLLVSSPYLFFLRQHYGTLTFSPKATYVLIWMKSRIYHDNDKGEIDNDELWGLTSDYRLKWQQPSGVGDLLRYLMSQPEKSVRVYLHNLSYQLPGRIPNNSGALHYPQVYPVYLAILAVLAAFWRWGDDSRLKKAVIFGPFLILLILPVFTEGWWKYLVPYAPLLLISATGGLFVLAGRVTPPWSALVPWFVTLGLAGYFAYCTTAKPAPPPNSNIQMRRNYADQSGKAARWIRQQFGPGKNYMTPWNKMIYDLDGFWTADPVAGYADKLEYARRNKVDYYLLEFSRNDIPLTAIIQPPPGLAFATLYQAPETDYAVAVYRLVPSPLTTGPQP